MTFDKEEEGRVGVERIQCLIFFDMSCLHFINGLCILNQSLQLQS